MKFETKVLPSGITVENRPHRSEKYCWYIKGTTIIHNEGEPAINIMGTKQWCQHGKLHRLDGPVIEYANGAKYYCVGNVSYNEKDYWNHPNVLAFKYLKEHPELEAFV